jgi:phage major head subunit gpT-like protein
MSAGMGIGAADLPVGPLTKGLKAIFKGAYNDALKTNVMSKIATYVSSNSDSEDFAFLGAVPKVREFVGPRVLHDLANFSYNIKNKTWENTIGVKREDYADNKLGLIKLQIQQLAIEAARYPEELGIGLLKLALANPTTAAYACFDGQGFFDTDHPAPRIVGGVAQDNLDAAALNYANLWAAVHKMALWQDDTGRYMNIKPNILLVGTYLEELALELTGSKYNADNTQLTAQYSQMKDNVAKSLGLEVIATPYLDTESTVANCNWCLLDTTKPVKPLIVQEREPVSFGSLEKDSDTGFMTGQYAYGTYARYNVGFGPWFTAYGSTGAA